MNITTLPIYNTEGKEVDTIKLDSGIFDGTVNRAVIYQVVNAYRANQRKGLAACKTRGEVSGGGRKPWRQKGTGRARHGSIRSPLWRHGGVVFGPHPRNFSHSLPGKLKTLALKSSLNAKLKENNIMVIDNFTIDKPKTKEAANLFSNLKINALKSNQDSKVKNKISQKKEIKKGRTQNVLLLLDKIDSNLKRALGNLDFLTFNLAKNTHAYEVLAAGKLIITKEGFKQLTERLSPVRNTKSLTGHNEISNGVNK